MGFVKFVRATHSYESEAEEEHNFEIGCKFLIVKEDSNGWYSGVPYITGRELLKQDVLHIPSTFVEQTSVIGTGIVKHNYESRGWDELNLNTGDQIDVYDSSDPQWWVVSVKNTNEVGIAPAIYLDSNIQEGKQEFQGAEGTRDESYTENQQLPKTPAIYLDSNIQESRPEFQSAEGTRDESYTENYQLPKNSFYSYYEDTNSNDKIKCILSVNDSITLKKIQNQADEIAHWEYTDICYFNVSKSDPSITLETVGSSFKIMIKNDEELDEINNIIQNGIINAKVSRTSDTPVEQLPKKVFPEHSKNVQAHNDAVFPTLYISKIATVTQSFRSIDEPKILFSPGEHIEVVDTSTKDKWFIKKLHPDATLVHADPKFLTLDDTTASTPAFPAPPGTLTPENNLQPPPPPARLPENLLSQIRNCDSDKLKPSHLSATYPSSIDDYSDSSPNVSFHQQQTSKPPPNESNPVISEPPLIKAQNNTHASQTSEKPPPIAERPKVSNIRPTVTPQETPKQKQHVTQNEFPDPAVIPPDIHIQRDKYHDSDKKKSVHATTNIKYMEKPANSDKIEIKGVDALNITKTNNKEKRKNEKKNSEKKNVEVGSSTNKHSNNDNILPGYRSWKDSTGSFTSVAKLLAYAQDSDNVSLLKENGVKISVPIKKLSLEDKEYLESLPTLFKSQTSKNSTEQAQEESSLKVEHKKDTAGSTSKPSEMSNFKYHPATVHDSLKTTNLFKLATSKRKEQHPKNKTQEFSFDWEEFFINTGISKLDSRAYAEKIKSSLPPDTNANKLNYNILKNIVEASDSDILKIFNLLEAEVPTYYEPQPIEYAQRSSDKKLVPPKAELKPPSDELHELIKSEKESEKELLRKEEAEKERKKFMLELQKKKEKTDETLKLAENALSKAHEKFHEASLLKEEYKQARAELSLRRAEATAKDALIMSIKAKEGYLKAVREAALESVNDQQRIAYLNAAKFKTPPSLPGIGEFPHISSISSFPPVTTTSSHSKQISTYHYIYNNSPLPIKPDQLTNPLLFTHPNSLPSPEYHQPQLMGNNSIPQSQLSSSASHVDTIPFNNINSTFNSGYQNYQPQNRSFSQNYNPFQNQIHPYQNQQSSYQNQQPPYQNQQPPYQNQQPIYQNQQPIYQNQQPIYQNQQPIYQNQHPSYHNSQFSYQNQQPSYQMQQPQYQNQKSTLPFFQNPQSLPAPSYQNRNQTPLNLPQPYQNSLNLPQPYQNQNSLNLPQPYQNQNSSNLPQLYQNQTPSNISQSYQNQSQYPSNIPQPYQNQSPNPTYSNHMHQSNINSQPNMKFLQNPNTYYPSNY